MKNRSREQIIQSQCSIQMNVTEVVIIVQTNNVREIALKELGKVIVKKTYLNINLAIAILTVYCRK